MKITIEDNELYIILNALLHKKTELTTQIQGPFIDPNIKLFLQEDLEEVNTLYSKLTNIY